jgi:hypothetical protein
MAVVGVLLVPAGWFGVTTALHACGGLGSGVTRVDDECIGVTDGFYVFGPAYADVEAKIARENKRVVEEVRKSGDKPVRAVTVALFLPMTVDETSPIDVEEVRHQMEGAYTAQWRVNRAPIAGDPDPLIRLVLANEGSHHQQWAPVVDQLASMRNADAPLVGVIGLGVSIDETRDAAQRLSEENIPMVATLATADSLNYQDYPGFVRVVPSNYDQVVALRKYLDQKRIDSAILVQDTNRDLFVESLTNNFTTLLGDLILYPTQAFSGKSTPAEATANIFAPVTSNICGAQPLPQVVLFAGRKIDLPSFLLSLEARTCRETPITVATVGSDTAALADEPALEETRLREANIVVALATSADPLSWEVGRANRPDGFIEFLSSFDDLFGAKDQLTDGEAILTYDALLTVARAIRLAAESKPAGVVPSSADVTAQMPNLNTLHSISGAGGTLSFRARGKDTGNPCGKPVPMLELPPGPPIELVYMTCE